MINKETVILQNIPFTIEPERVLREMRISKIERLDQLEEKPLREAIKHSIDRAYTLIHGKGIYRNLLIAENEKAMDEVFTGKTIKKHLDQCEYVSALACTIGPGLEDEIERLANAGEVTESYLLDAIGGWMADYMADRVDETIERVFKKAGYERTKRYSPGYGDWELENQSNLLALTEADRIGIALTDTSIMIPRKSVSAVIGWK